jgi:hypothetical protein
MATPPTMPMVPSDDDLYLAVLPLVHYSRHFAGESFEEVMTLVPDRNFATEFSAVDVDRYIQTFRNAAEEKYGGPVRRFKYEKYPTPDGRVYVVVTKL